MRNETELLPGERVLWTGTPVASSFVTRQDTFLVVPALALFGATITYFGKENTPASRLAGAATVLMIVLVTAGALVWRRWKLGTTAYTITDRRVVESYFQGTERFEYLTMLDPPVIVPRSDGTGTVAFGVADRVSVALAAFGLRRWRSGLTGVVLIPMMLIGIEDPDEVYDLLIQAMGEARAP